MGKCRCALLFIWIVPFFSASVFPASHPAPIRFQHLSVKDGLSQSTVNCIVQDTYGFMWFGTDDGLNRFDGYQVEVYRHDAGDANSLGGSFINVLHVDRCGTLWIGTTSGLNRYLPATDSFARYRMDHIGPQRINDNIITAIAEDGSGNLWIGTGGGLNRMGANRDRVYRYDLNSGQAGKNKGEPVAAICEVEPGVLWIASPEWGLFRYLQSRDTIEPLPGWPDQKEPTPAVSFRTLYRDKSGGVWLGSWKNGLFLHRPDSKKWRNYRARPDLPDGLGHDEVKAVLQDRSGRIWIATFGGGLHTIDPFRNSFRRFQTDPDQPQSLSSNSVRTIYEDRSGILWVGTQGGGVDYYNPDRYKLSPPPALPEIISRESIASICEDRSGNLWIGTSNKGLLRFHPHTGRTDFAHTLPGAPDSLRRNRTTTLFEDHLGEMWIGTYGGGLCRFDPKRGTFTCFRHESHNSTSISSDFIVWFCEDKSGTLWIATHDGGGFSGGLNRLNRESMTFTHFLNREGDPASLSYNGVNVVHTGEPGILWVGTFHGGLNRFDTRSGRFTHFLHHPDENRSLSHNCVTSIFPDHLGRLWVGTLDGLNCLDPGRKGFDRYGQGEGLANNVIYGILGDSRHNIWLSTNRGISKLNLEKLDIKNYDTTDGLINSEYNMGAFFRSKNGSLYFGGIHGLDMLNPETIRDNLYAPPVWITGFQVLGRGKPPVSGLPPGRSILDTRTLNLPHHANDLSFTFVALNFSSPDKNRYAFKMEGLDPDWTYRDGTQRFAAYREMKSGRYLFRVKGANNNGIWNEKGTFIRITIAHPFWQTWWFRIAALLTFTILSTFTIHFLRTHSKLVAFWKKKKFFGSYEIDEQIGSGGMGVVYRVHHLTDKKHFYAMKVLRAELEMDEMQKRRFASEARVIDRIDHPHIVKIIERGESNRQPYIVMELLEGIDLGEKIRKEGALSGEESLIITSQVCSALIELHRENILHRDMKPENILLLNAKKPEIKLLDFGLARSQLATTHFTESGQIMGTIPYMPPELISGKETAASADIYSLGVILFEMLTGKKPFSGDSTLQIYRAILRNNPPPPISIRPDIPEELNRLVLDMLNKNPMQRPSAEQVLTTLPTIYPVPPFSP